eukprot:c9349_g1_i1.p1 GENE.c9349_g1_i1~~c9349_g1_i1.p1  ORF type:complete len:598 (-),score=107.25 c9349_g1_i1:469-2262(-)
MSRPDAFELASAPYLADSQPRRDNQPRRDSQRKEAPAKPSVPSSPHQIISISQPQPLFDSPQPAPPQQPPPHQHHHHHRQGQPQPQKTQFLEPVAKAPKARQNQENAQNRPQLTRQPSSARRLALNAGAGSMRAVAKVGGAVNTHRHQMVRNAEIRQRMVEASIRSLELDPTPENQKKLEKLKTFVRRQVEKREKSVHKPYFTCLATIIQLILIIAMLYVGPIASWGFGVTTAVHEVNLFVDTTNQTVQRAQNPYYGPQVESLVKWGSKWSPCMRKQKDVSDYQAQTLTDEATYGCCINSNAECGMMSEYMCGNFTRSTFAGVGRNCSSYSNCMSIKLRPCCYGIFGQCAMLTEQHCSVLNGFWDKEKDKCSESMCIFQQCGMGYPEVKWTPNGKSQPNQFYRFLTANFLHVGIVHFIFNALGQYVLVSQVELIAGFWRTAAMYIISGSCGFMISAIFTTNFLSNGSSAAIYGMLGVETVDLFQTWQLFENPWKMLPPLLLKLAIYLGVGTLPYIDNFAHVGGFLAGIVCGLVFLPYIVFGTFDGYRKACMQITGVVGLVTITIVILAVFYTRSSISCTNCKYIDCVPYKKGMCDLG